MFSLRGRLARQHASNFESDSMRLGLCCIFRDQPIKFRTTTATAIKRLSRDEGRKKLADLCAANAAALMEALQFCSANGIGCFRVNSQILPLKTHPEVGYDLAELPGGRQIVEPVSEMREAFAKAAGLRTTFHPDQFVVLELTEARCRRAVDPGDRVSGGGRPVDRGRCHEHPCRRGLRRQAGGVGTTLPRILPDCQERPASC